jgi:adenylate cyclase
MESKIPERQLAAILMADVAGYSRLTQTNEDETFLNVRHSLKLFTDICVEKQGEVIGYRGDSILAIFSSARNALQSALDAQKKFYELNKKKEDDQKIVFRIGLNLGDIICQKNDVFGDDVNIASRIESLAPVGGISISGSFYDAVSSKVPYEFLFRGEQKVKNISAPVRVYDVVHENLNATSNQKSGSDKFVSANWLRSSIVMLFVIFAAAGVFYFLASPERSSKTAAATQVETHEKQKPSIAVLPFSNLSNDPEQVYFSDGISEDLITDLSKVSGLFVIARASSFRYRQQELDLHTISEELNVKYLVTGSVRKLGSVIRISAQLLEISTGKQIWGDRYDRPVEDIFALQDEVIKQIVAGLEVQLTDKEQSSLTKKLTSSVEAYDYFLKGRNEHSRLSSVGNQASKAFFEQAIAIDPNFADAYAFLAWAYARDYLFEWSSDPEAALQQAVKLIEKAIEINPRRNFVLDVYGVISLFQGKHIEAVSAVEKAISINPNHADSHAMLAFILNYAGRPEKSAEIMKTAIQLNPLHTYMYLYVLGTSQFLRSRYEDAVLSFSDAVSRNPEDNQIRLWLAASYALMGNIEDAEWQVFEILADNPEYSIKDVRERIPFKNPEHLEKLSEGLRRARLPENRADN